MQKDDAMPANEDSKSKVLSLEFRKTGLKGCL
jgi:hypothetical protein